MSDVYDINFNILLESDIDSISNLCQVNKQFNQICNDSYFWKRKFQYDGIPFTMIRNGISSDYFLLYKKNRSILKEATDIVNNIKLNKYPENWGVGITFDSLEYNDLDLLTIDIVLLKKLYDEIEKLDDEDILSPQIIFRYDERGFTATIEVQDLTNFSETDTTITFFLTEQQLIEIIYNLINKNVRIYDVNYDDVVRHNNIYNNAAFIINEGEISDVNNNYDNYYFTTQDYEDDNLNGVNEYYFGDENMVDY